MDPWSKGDYSRHIREASMAMEGLPEVVPPSGRVPGQLLRAAPILKWRRRYREENGDSRSILGVSSAGAKYRPKVGPLPSFLGDSGSFRDADILYNFSGIYRALLMARKPEIQKQQKTGTGNWVH